MGYDARSVASHAFQLPEHGLGRLQPGRAHAGDLGSSSGHGLLLWDAAAGNQVRVFADDADFVGPPEFSPDGLLVATVSNRARNDIGLRMWEPPQEESCDASLAMRGRSSVPIAS